MLDNLQTTLDDAEIILADAIPDETLLTYGEKYDILGSCDDFTMLTNMLLDLILGDVNTRDMLTIDVDTAVDALTMADRSSIGNTFRDQLIIRYMNNDILKED